MNLFSALLVMFLYSCSSFRSFRSVARYGRLFSLERSLDTELIACEKDFMCDQVRRRGMNHLEASIARIGEIRKKKNDILFEMNAARKVRNDVSKNIGILMQQGKKDAVPELKAKVEEATALALQKEIEKEELEFELNNLFSTFPNLLDITYVYH